MRLNPQQMLAHWRRAHGHEAARSDCSVEIFEGMDTQVSMSAKMRQWYLRMLDTAPLRYVTLTDISGRISAERTGDGTWRVDLPQDVRRLVSLRLQGCAHDAAVRPRGDDDRGEALQANRYSRSGQWQPKAVAEAGGRTVTLYCRGMNTAVITEARAVTDPGDETYEFNESALTLLNNPDYEQRTACSGL